MKTTSFLLAAATLATTRADEYFTGDGTAYTLGQTSAGNCNMMSALDFATTYYAALNDKQWDGLQNCGRCAEVSCDDDRCSDKSQSITVQILDRCPECAYGDLDLSPTVFTALTGSTPSRYTIKWKFVDCPVSGNVNYCLKGGSNNFWSAVQPTNVATGVQSLKINGQDTTMLSSAYYYLLDGASQTQTDLSSVTISLTDVNGNSIEDTVSLTADSCTEGSSQFPFSAGSSPSTQTQTQTSSTPTTTTTTPTPTTVAPKTSAPTTATPTPSPTPTTQTPSPTTVRPATTAPTTQQEVSPTPVPVSTTATPTTTAPATTAPAPTTTTPATTAPVTAAPSTTIPATIAPVETTQEPQSTYASTTGSDASQTVPQGSSSSFNATGTETPASTTATKKTAETESISSSTIAPSTQQKSGLPAATTATPSTNADQTADSQGDDYTQSANTKSEDNSNGTDWTIIGLSSAAGVGVVALIVVVVMVKRKQIHEEKARDFEAPSMMSMQSFDVQNTPADRARNFGIL